METPRRRRWLIPVIAVLAVMLVAAAVLYRTTEIAASSYETQAARWWATAVGGYDNFANQVLSLKPEPKSADDVCHAAKVALQDLNQITLTTNVPGRYAQFHAAFADAIDANKQYYKRIVGLCARGFVGNGTVMTSLFSLGKDVEDHYAEAHRLMADLRPSVEQGTYSRVNEHLAKMLSARPSQPTATPAKPRVVRVPQYGYNPSFPPAIGSVVIIKTPAGGRLNLREAPSLDAPRVYGRETVDPGERVLVLDRVGDWLYVQTTDGYRGYIRWWYIDVPYVRP